MSCTRLQGFLTQTLRDELESRGYSSAPMSLFKWETPAEFSRRHGYHSNWLCKMRTRSRNIPAFECDKGKSGRLIRIRSNPALEEWMTK